MLLGLYTKLKLKRQASRSADYQTVLSDSTEHPHDRTLTVESINDPRVIDLLQATQPELVIVLGTEIIREKVLAAAPRFVNVHAGITPLYRGAHGQFWAALNRDFEHLGVTLHVVDRGIDTGGILGQACFLFEPAIDNLLTLLAKSARCGAKLLIDWIHTQCLNFRDITLQPPPAGASHLYYSPGFRDYRRFETLCESLLQEHPAKAVDDEGAGVRFSEIGGQAT